EELMASFQGVASPVRPARYVVEIENPFDGKRDVSSGLNESQVAPRIRDFGQVNDSTMVYFRHVSPCFLFQVSARRNVRALCLFPAVNRDLGQFVIGFLPRLALAQLRLF